VTPEQDARAFRALTRKISDARGVVCEAYKEKCLRRRIAVRMRARGVHTFEDYARLLDGDAGEYDLLLDAHDQRHEVLPQRRDVARARALPRRAVGTAPR